ncbi:phage tail protein [Sphingomonas sp. M1-B02]|uniref:phage tail protein n=1 Tax=Sphingomonas sp. M1-B02 TaxID=3114300 RepID=UPI0022403A3C|nr:tail fiber protein [Sphingomonas sp. S6-11]UZK66219.1 tail fiber protein [Sphingomonas sp. S6-11]
MSDPFLGEIKQYGFPFAPRGWAFAAGQTLPLRQYTSLFSLIGTVFGGNGTTTFQLPNLASLQACGSGTGPNTSPRQIGDRFGSAFVTITSDTMPMHNHGMQSCTGSPNPTAIPASNSCLGAFTTTAIYATPATGAPMSPSMVLPTGGGQPHSNLQPYLGLNFSIAMVGQFPSFS